jgi:hypothetical protein
MIFFVEPLRIRGQIGDIAPGDTPPVLRPSRAVAPSYATATLEPLSR